MWCDESNVFVTAWHRPNCWSPTDSHTHTCDSGMCLLPRIPSLTFDINRTRYIECFRVCLCVALLMLVFARIYITIFDQRNSLTQFFMRFCVCWPFENGFCAPLLDFPCEVVYGLGGLFVLYGNDNIHEYNHHRGRYDNGNIDQLMYITLDITLKDYNFHICIRTWINCTTETCLQIWHDKTHIHMIIAHISLWYNSFLESYHPPQECPSASHNCVLVVWFQRANRQAFTGKFHCYCCVTEANQRTFRHIRPSYSS